MQLSVLKETLTAQNRRYSRILGSQFQLPQAQVRGHIHAHLLTHTDTDTTCIYHIHSGAYSPSSQPAVAIRGPSHCRS